MKLFLIAFFGVLGVFSRYFMDVAIGPSQGFPWGTFLVNLIGSFIAGAVYGLGYERSVIPPELRTALTVGLLGGFTTFSAFSVQALNLLVNDRLFTAMAYLAASPLLGVMMAFAGRWIVSH